MDSNHPYYYHYDMQSGSSGSMEMPPIKQEQVDLALLSQGPSSYLPPICPPAQNNPAPVQPSTMQQNYPNAHNVTNHLTPLNASTMHRCSPPQNNQLTPLKGAMPNNVCSSAQNSITSMNAVNNSNSSGGLTLQQMTPHPISSPCAQLPINQQNQNQTMHTQSPPNQTTGNQPLTTTGSKKRGKSMDTPKENGEPAHKQALTTDQTALSKSTSPNVKQEPITEKLPVRKKRDRFNGMTEEEVLKRTLPDHVAHNLDIIIVGINPGLTAAYIGHHYAGPGNHFWKCLYLSGLIPEPLTAYDDKSLLEYGIGFTNIVERTSRGSSDLTRKEIKDGGEILKEKILKWKPKIAVFNGKGIYEIFCGHKNFHIGKQPEPFPGTQTTCYVMPSSSARCSQLPRAIDKVPFYVALKKLRDHVRGDNPLLDEAEVCFPDLELKVKVREDKLDNSDSKKNMKQESKTNSYIANNQQPNVGMMAPGVPMPHGMMPTNMMAPNMNTFPTAMYHDSTYRHQSVHPATHPDNLLCKQEGGNQSWPTHAAQHPAQHPVMQSPYFIKQEPMAPGYPTMQHANNTTANDSRNGNLPQQQQTNVGSSHQPSHQPPQQQYQHYPSTVSPAQPTHPAQPTDTPTSNTPPTQQSTPPSSYQHWHPSTQYGMPPTSQAHFTSPTRIPQPGITAGVGNNTMSINMAMNGPGMGQIGFSADVNCSGTQGQSFMGHISMSNTMNAVQGNATISSSVNNGQNMPYVKQEPCVKQEGINNTSGFGSCMMGHS